MITENLSTLKIHKMSQAQYDRELAAGRIDENALYLTPDDNNVGSGSSVRYDERQKLTEEQRTQARHNIGAVEINDIYKHGLQEFYYTWDGTMDGRDTITVANTNDNGTYFYFYKVSDEVPHRNLIRNFNEALVTYNNGYTEVRNEGGDNNQSWSSHYFHERNHWYAITGVLLDWTILFIEQAGAYSFYDSDEYSFNAPSPGVYFPCYLSGDGTDVRYIASLELAASYKRGIYLNANYQKFTVELDDNGAIQTVDSNGNVIWDGSNMGETKVYVQDEAPTDTSEGSLWIDTDDEGLPNAPENATPNIHVVDAKTSDMTQVDFTEYKIGDIVLVTLS